MQELKPNRPNFETMSAVDVCAWHVAKYEQCVANASTAAWKRHFKAELVEWKGRLAKAAK